MWVFWTPPVLGVHATWKEGEREGGREGGREGWRLSRYM
jgi:hypothetical protein